jgi:hypothetical protein
MSGTAAELRGRVPGIGADGAQALVDWLSISALQARTLLAPAAA